MRGAETPNRKTESGKREAVISGNRKITGSLVTSCMIQ